MWNQVSYDPCNYERSLNNCDIEAWNSQDFNRVWTCDLMIPMWRSNQPSYEATDVESSLLNCVDNCKDHSLLGYLHNTLLVDLEKFLVLRTSIHEINGLRR